MHDEFQFSSLCRIHIQPIAMIYSVGYRLTLRRKITALIGTKYLLTEFNFTLVSIIDINLKLQLIIPKIEAKEIPFLSTYFHKVCREKFAAAYTSNKQSLTENRC